VISFFRYGNATSVSQYRQFEVRIQNGGLAILAGITSGFRKEDVKSSSLTGKGVEQ